MPEKIVVSPEVASFFSDLSWHLPLFDLAIGNVIKRAGDGSAGVEIFDGDETGAIQAINFRFSGNTQGNEVLGLLAGGTGFNKNSNFWFYKSDLEVQRPLGRPIMITPVKLVNQIGFTKKFSSEFQGKVFFEYEYYDRVVDAKHSKKLSQETKVSIPNSFNSLFDTVFLKRKMAEPDINHLSATLVFPDSIAKQQRLRRLFDLSEDQKIYFCEIQPDRTVIIRGDYKINRHQYVEFKRLDLDELESVLGLKTDWENISAGLFSLTTDEVKLELSVGKLREDYGEKLFGDALLPITDSNVIITSIQ